LSPISKPGLRILGKSDSFAVIAAGRYRRPGARNHEELKLAVDSRSVQSTTVTPAQAEVQGCHKETAALGFPLSRRFRGNDGLRAGPALLIGFVVSLATVLCLSISLAGGAARGDDPIVETSHASIESREGQALRVMFAAEGQPALYL
jgi:hypothetical protein